MVLLVFVPRLQRGALEPERLFCDQRKQMYDENGISSSPVSTSGYFFELVLRLLPGVNQYIDRIRRRLFFELSS